LRAVLELNTPDAFRGVVRQGETIALLPESALVEARHDPTLAVRSLAPLSSEVAVDAEKNGENSQVPWNRQVAIVTTRDRLQIPPIEYFWKLVHECVPEQHPFHPRESATFPVS
jgi:DNA-binding transcriptional LysR family regulator